MKIDNTFDNPIGAVPPPIQSQADGYSPVPLEQVYGRGGSVRHAGSFSPDNPAYQQLLAAQQGGGKNQDIDALYEKAVQWEIDNSNTERQHAYEQAMRDEQREYEDPVNQLARQRAAGINPDVAGSGSGVSSGSSSPMAVSPRLNTPTQTKFSNAYDNTNMVLSGINTTANLLGAITSFGSGFVQCFDTLKTMPSRVSIGQTQANILKETAPAVISSAKAASEIALATKDSQIESAKQDVTAKRLANASAGASLVKDIAGILPAGASDDDIKTAMNKAGVPDTEQPSMLNAIRGYLNNPQKHASDSESTKRANQADAYNAVHSLTALTKLEEVEYQVDLVGKEIQLLTSNIQQSYLKYLEDSNYAVNKAQTEIDKELALGHQYQADSEKAKLAKKQIERDVSAFSSSLMSVDKAIKDCEKRKNAIRNRSRAEGREMTAFEELQCASEDMRYWRLMSLGSRSLYEVFSIWAGSAGNEYRNRIYLKKGELQAQFFTNRSENFFSLTFSDLVNGLATYEDLSSTLVNMVVGSGANAFMQVAKPAQGGNTYNIGVK